jgi:hypothetical protein
MSRKITVELDELDWGVVQNALYREAGELAATEARRTGGRGWSSGGKSRHLDQIHKIYDVIKEKVDDQRRKPEVVR